MEDFLDTFLRLKKKEKTNMTAPHIDIVGRKSR